MVSFNTSSIEEHNSPLPRLEQDPFDLEANNEEIEPLNSAKYTQATKFQEYENTHHTNRPKPLNLESYGRPSSMELENSDILSNDDFLEGSPNKKYRKHKYRKNKYDNRSPRNLLMALVVIVPVIIVAMLFVLLKWTSSSESKNAAPAIAPTGLTYPSGFNMKNNWGSLSPYFDTGATFPGIDSSVNEGLHELPEHYTLSQVHVLHRHAERYPTTETGRSMEETALKLKNMTAPPEKALEWIKDWEYALDLELLVSRGYATMLNSGASFWASHGIKLFNATQGGHFLYDPKLNVYQNGTTRPPVVIRATSQSRIRNSAKAWAAGFFGLTGEDPARSEESVKLLKDPNNIYKLVLQTEAEKQNSTLASYFSCPNSSNATYNTGKPKAQEWIDVYLKEAVVRLSKLLPGLNADTSEHETPSTPSADGNNKKKTSDLNKAKPQSTLTTTDVYNMQHFCAFETAAYGSSAFCNLFTEKEWRGYEYAADLFFYGISSYGTPIGAAEGAGWLYELLARLEGRQLDDKDAGWGVNTTVTKDPTMFPVDQPMYLDMSHDDILISVLTALGLDFLKEDLPANKILAPRQFILSRLAPFGARIFVERVECNQAKENEISAREEKKVSAQESDKESKNTFIRMKVNNRVIPLNSLKKCPVSKEGLCPLSDFIESLKYALSQIDFDKNCYGVPKEYEI